MTQSYIGTKQVLAWDQDKDGQPGYAVKYADGYTSWSPKDVFEASYLPMGHVSNIELHEQRVVGELVQLSDRVKKLRAFTGGIFFARLHEDEKTLLLSQLNAMVDYEEILKSRVSAFAWSIA